MASTNLLRIALASVALAGATTAFAADTKDAAPAKGTAQTHHCKLSDGSMDMGKTKKACVAAKGTWAKDAAASGAAPAAPAPSAAVKK